MSAASQEKPAELAGAEQEGSPEHDARIFKQVTKLFLSNVDHLSESQISAVDGVLAHLVGRVDAATVVDLSDALSTLQQAPLQTIRKLALHGNSAVAGPVRPSI